MRYYNIELSVSEPDEKMLRETYVIYKSILTYHDNSDKIVDFDDFVRGVFAVYSSKYLRKCAEETLNIFRDCYND